MKRHHHPYTLRPQCSLALCSPCCAVVTADHDENIGVEGRRCLNAMRPEWGYLFGQVPCTVLCERTDELCSLHVLGYLTRYNWKRGMFVTRYFAMIPKLIWKIDPGGEPQDRELDLQCHKRVSALSTVVTSACIMHAYLHVCAIQAWIQRVCFLFPM